MRVVNVKDPVTPKAPAIKIARLKTAKLSVKNSFKQSPVRGFNPQPGGTNMFGTRAMKSPEDYETAESVQGLGKGVSPYYSQQYAQKGRNLRYDTATNTYR